MIKAIIVDDEKGPRDLLASLLTDFIDGVEVVGKAENAASAKKLIEQENPDILFLDIEMPGVNGFSLLHSLEDISFEVVFTTAYSQYAIQAIKENALDYLLKPIQLDELVAAIAKFKQRKSSESGNESPTIIPNGNYTQHQQSNKIVLPLSQGYKLVSIADILYCEASGGYTNFNLKNNIEILVTKHLKLFEAALTKYGLVRIHDAFLVNIHHVDSYVRKNGPGGEVILSNGKIIQVSRGKKSVLLDKLKEFKIDI